MVLIAWRSSWLASRAKGGARTSGCALRPLMACPVSSWTDPRVRCRLLRSRLRATSSGRCTWCAIRTSCGTWRRHPRRTRTVPHEQACVDSSCRKTPTRASGERRQHDDQEAQRVEAQPGGPSSRLTFRSPLASHCWRQQERNVQMGTAERDQQVRAGGNYDGDWNLWQYNVRLTKPTSDSE